MSVFYFLVKMCYQDNSGCNNMWIWISFWNKSLIFPGIKKFRLICSKLATNLCKGWQLLTTCQMKYNNCSFIILCWWTGRYSTWFKLSSICFFFLGGGLFIEFLSASWKVFLGGIQCHNYAGLWHIKTNTTKVILKIWCTKN